MWDVLLAGHALVRPKPLLEPAVLSLAHAVSCIIQLFSSTEVPAKCIKAFAVHTSLLCNAVTVLQLH